MGVKTDLTGQRFGRLTAIKPVGYDKQKNIMWECLCDCGKTSIARASGLRFGNPISCGCMKAYNGMTHGLSRHPLYNTWLAMRDRCCNAKNKKYNIYGGRGIIVCDRWLNSFENFYADMGEKPTKKHSLDRYPDANGNYEPSNCRWATTGQQNRNKKGCVIIEYNGEKKNAVDWAKYLGMTKGTFLGRIKMGWDMERVMKGPIGKIGKLTDSQAEEIRALSIDLKGVELAKMFGVNGGTISSILLNKNHTKKC